MALPHRKVCVGVRTGTGQEATAVKHQSVVTALRGRTSLELQMGEDSET